MAKLIQLSRHRARLGRPTLTVPKGDWDLVPIAVVLWIASVARLAAGAGEVFRTEATLALVCALAIPCWLLRSWLESAERKAEQDRREDAHGAQTSARIIQLTCPARSTGAQRGDST